MKINKTIIILATFILLFTFNSNAFELYEAVLQGRPNGIGQMVSSIDGKYYYRFNEAKSAIEKGRLSVLFGHKIEINCPA